VTEEGLQTADYLPFSGILLTDTFLRGRGDDVESMEGDLFPESDERARKQDELDITVVIGNPPYSAGQESQNDGNANLKYPEIDERIASTYARRSTSRQQRSLYDSYVRAIRWASDRIEDRGVVAFVTNGSYVDSNTADGLRACLVDEYTKLWIYNLRGNQRTPDWRREGGKIFEGGSQLPVAIMVLVRNPESRADRAVHYHDVGDYLDREHKLALLRSLPMAAIDWRRITPNDASDWINMRDPRFATFDPIDGADGIFLESMPGINTSRDAWTVGSDRAAIVDRCRDMVDLFNAEARRVGPLGLTAAEVVSHVERDPTRINWSERLFQRVARGDVMPRPSEVVITAYRPWNRQFVLSGTPLVERPSKMHRILRGEGERVLQVAGVSSPFGALVVDAPPNFSLLGSGKCLPRFTWRSEEEDAQGASRLIDDGHERIDNINPRVLSAYRAEYVEELTGDDLFDYVYGVLHSPEYRTRFAADLNKVLPRIPRVTSRATFDAFRDAGRLLADLHVSYEVQDPYPLEELVAEGAPTLEYDRYRVAKMKHPKVRGADGLVEDRSTIVYNEYVTLAGIPEDAYRYEVGPRSAIAWVMDRYRVRTDKSSGILNDPNDWSREVGDPRYVIDLLARIVTVSIETNRIVDSLPSLDLD
jgi:predicted helicase